VAVTASKTGQPRRVQVPEVLCEAVTALVPRDDRVSERLILQGFGADRFRTALRRAVPRRCRRSAPTTYGIGG